MKLIFIYWHLECESLVEESQDRVASTRHCLCIAVVVVISIVVYKAAWATFNSMWVVINVRYVALYRTKGESCVPSPSKSSCIKCCS